MSGKFVSFSRASCLCATVEFSVAEISEIFTPFHRSSLLAILFISLFKSILSDSSFASIFSSASGLFCSFVSSSAPMDSNQPCIHNIVFAMVSVQSSCRFLFLQSSNSSVPPFSM